ncbi:RluA family pseudouridine synthase [Campylobacter sp. RM13119]|uniref:RNA pseudouridylate synthase n=1 Tax=Campylobacter californiensis TaxID=1032243 RepID=A0ABD4JHA3_9BACT|nr:MULTISPECIES: RluA family pseudouridine synthase [unclassified Campylobacter]MBE2986134.1 RluA family pseudouridine synthase [Campylobacter sp. RM12919]MBE2987546.1 RluA family pseudouridine synthase [Campylobacter sp. RM12920]MBE3606258.1 RluA family pseudouridine synthase [Campylobacter sp. RM13119]
MSSEKAYKLLALQEGISNNEAKALIDDGLVYAKGQKILIARALMGANTRFNVQEVPKPSVIFEDENLIAINKPAFITSEKISEIYKFPLLHRLDKETSGVLLLVKDEEFAKKAIEEFKHMRVAKTYVAAIKGIVSEEININEPILTIKTKGGAHSKISKDGKEAISKVTPLMVVGKKSLVKVEIKTGRTHQIRVHLSSVNAPIVGDEKYGKNRSARMYLHAYYIGLLGYNFKANIPKDFNALGFEISNKFEI